MANKAEHLLHLLQTSPAAGKIVGARKAIESHLRAQPRRVWPGATIARHFGISASLLRKWMDMGLIARFKPPSRHYRAGLTERSIRDFLRGLSKQAEWGIGLVRIRDRPAEERCRKAFRELQPGEAPSTREFAARAGVAVTTVHRLLACGILQAWYPTPYRPKICGWQEKDRRKRLTRKKPKKAF